MPYSCTVLSLQTTCISIMALENHAVRSGAILFALILKGQKAQAKKQKGLLP